MEEGVGESVNEGVDQSVDQSVIQMRVVTITDELPLFDIFLQYYIMTLNKELHDNDSQ